MYVFKFHEVSKGISPRNMYRKLIPNAKIEDNFKIFTTKICRFTTQPLEGRLASIPAHPASF